MTMTILYERSLIALIIALPFPYSVNLAGDVENFLTAEPDVIQLTTSYKQDARIVAHFFSRVSMSGLSPLLSHGF